MSKYDNNAHWHQMLRDGARLSTSHDMKRTLYGFRVGHIWRDGFATAAEAADAARECMSAQKLPGGFFSTYSYEVSECVEL